MGQVMLTRDLMAQERPLAVKLLLPEYRDSTSEFMREYAVQRRLDHPAIPKVYDFGFGEHAGREVPYFAMDYVRGVPMSSALLQLPEPTVGFHWVLELLRGLDHVHRAGFLHRDLKPSNVLVTWDGAPGDTAHLIDFGIAVPFDEAPEELFIGTPEYSAPELMAGVPFDVRQDLYAIGLLLYELVSGRRPWAGDDPTDLYNKRMFGSYAPLVHPACPHALATLIDQLLAPRMERRPASAAEVIERMAGALGIAFPIEPAPAFRRRLETVLFEESEAFEEGAAAWLGEGPAPHPAVLILEDPPGFDGVQLMHELTDRAAVGGARVLRFRLPPRAHAPLEAIEPVLALLERLREARGTTSPRMGGLAGAATMLSRLPGPMVVAIEGLNWADTLTLELLTTVFTGARNPGLRVIATVDPGIPPLAERVMARLRALPVTRYVARTPLTTPMIADWVDLVVGPELVPDGHIAQLTERSQGRPERVRELLTEDLRRHALIRERDGFRWDTRAATPIATRRPPLDGKSLDAATSAEPHTPSPALAELLPLLETPVPEAVASIYLGVAPAVVHQLVADGLLARDPSREQGAPWLGLGPRLAPAPAPAPNLAQSHHDRLAHALEHALPFVGKAERTANAWLRSSDPLRAVPYLLDAAQQAGLPRQGDRRPRAAALLDEAGRVLDRVENAAPSQQAETVKLNRLQGLRLDLAGARVRLARALGDRPAWQRAATDLFERALTAGHLASMEAALDALMQLAADRCSDEDLLRHARALADLAPGRAWAIAWARAIIDVGVGRPRRAVERLEEALRDTSLSSERRGQLLLLLAGITTGLGWVVAAETAIAELEAYGNRTADRAAHLWGGLFRASLLRQRQLPHEALGVLRRLGSELGDDRFYRLDGLLSLELGRAHAALGWADTAHEHFSQAMALARRDGDADTLLRARLGDLLLVADAGAPEEANQLLNFARDELAGVRRAGLRELELTELTLAWRDPKRPGPAILDAFRRLADAAFDEENRELGIIATVAAARGALRLGQDEEALRLTQVAVQQSATWGGVGVPRHVLLFLLARVREARREGWRARRAASQARSELHRVAALIPDGAQRQAYLALPEHVRIETSDLWTVGPHSRPSTRPEG